jgi:hypothetical protein
MKTENKRIQEKEEEKKRNVGTLENTKPTKKNN